MATEIIRVDAQRLAGQMRMRVEIKRDKQWRWRLKLGTWLIRLAAWVMWMDLDIKVDGEQWTTH